MRMHIELDDEVVERIDSIAGQRGRSRFVRQAVVDALDRHRRAELVRSARGAVSEGDHEWDGDPAAWVQEQRRSQPRRVG